MDDLQKLLQSTLVGRDPKILKKGIGLDAASTEIESQDILSGMLSLPRAPPSAAASAAEGPLSPTDPMATPPAAQRTALTEATSATATTYEPAALGTAVR